MPGRASRSRYTTPTGPLPFYPLFDYTLYLQFPPPPRQQSSDSLWWEVSLSSLLRISIVTSSLSTTITITPPQNLFIVATATRRAARARPWLWWQLRLPPGDCQAWHLGISFCTLRASFFAFSISQERRLGWLTLKFIVCCAVKTRQQHRKTTPPLPSITDNHGFSHVSRLHE